MSDIRTFATTNQLVIWLETSKDRHMVILRKTPNETIKILGGDLIPAPVTNTVILALFGEAIVGKWLRGETE